MISQVVEGLRGPGLRTEHVVFGEQVLLRSVREDDLEQLRTWYNHPEIFPYMGRETHLTADDQHQWYFSQVSDDDSEVYAIESRETGELIGSLTLRKLTSRARCGEIGILLGYASSGYGSDAIRAVVSHAFADHELNCVSLEVRGDNTRAITCYMRAGFRPEGVLRRRLSKGGVLFDLYSMSILPVGILRANWSASMNLLENTCAQEPVLGARESG